MGRIRSNSTVHVRAFSPEKPIPDRTAAVLVVDEDPSVRSAIVRLLDRHGMLAVGVEQGPEAVRSVTELSGSLRAVIVDLSLRSESGLKLVRHLRRRHPALPVLIFAAPDDQVGRRECASLGACVCLAKPSAPDEIVRAVRGAIESSEAS